MAKEQAIIWCLKNVVYSNIYKQMNSNQRRFNYI